MPSFFRPHRVLLISLFLAAMLSGCAMVELGGRISRKTGEALTDYAKTNDGVIGQAAGVAGTVYTTTGTEVESAAKRSADGQSPSGQQSNGPAGAGAARSVGTGPVGSKSGLTVAGAQKRLNELGYSAGAADGVFGRKTVDAIRRFQSDRGLAITGKLDSSTSDALLRDKTAN